MDTKETLGRIKAIYDIAFGSPELSMSNYDEQQVDQLNDAMVEVCGELEELINQLEDKIFEELKERV